MSVAAVLCGAQGSLDEAAEHLAFERAVEAWRLGKDMPAVKGSCYECYKLFYKVRWPPHAATPPTHEPWPQRWFTLSRFMLVGTQESSQFEDEGKSFCSASCQAKHADTQARIKQQQVRTAPPHYSYCDNLPRVTPYPSPIPSWCCGCAPRRMRRQVVVRV